MKAKGFEDPTSSDRKQREILLLAFLDCFFPLPTMEFIREVSVPLAGILIDCRQKVSDRPRKERLPRVEQGLN